MPPLAALLKIHFSQSQFHLHFPGSVKLQYVKCVRRNIYLLYLIFIVHAISQNYCRCSVHHFFFTFYSPSI